MCEDSFRNSTPSCVQCTLPIPPLPWTQRSLNRWIWCCSNNRFDRKTYQRKVIWAIRDRKMVCEKLNIYWKHNTLSCSINTSAKNCIKQKSHLSSSTGVTCSVSHWKRCRFWWKWDWVKCWCVWYDRKYWFWIYKRYRCTRTEV